MIKTRGTASDGAPVVLLGLSRFNLDRLAIGLPISFNLRDLGLASIYVVITGGENEKAIVETLQVAGLLPPGFVENLDFTEDGHPRKKPTDTSE